MNKVLLFVFVIGIQFSYSQNSYDTIVDFFQEIKSALNEIDFEEILPKEDIIELKMQFKSSVSILDSILMVEKISLDSVMNQVKIDMQMVKDDLLKITETEEFQEAKQDFVKELKTIIEELESSN